MNGEKAEDKENQAAKSGQVERMLECVARALNDAYCSGIELSADEYGRGYNGSDQHWNDNCELWLIDAKALLHSAL